MRALPFVVVEIAHDALSGSPFTIETEIELQNTRYRLFGILYSGNHHFTSRIIDKMSQVWYHDGILMRRQPVLEGTCNQLNLQVATDGRKAYIVLFVRDQEVS